MPKKFKKPKFHPKKNSFTDSIGQTLFKIHLKDDDCDNYGCIIHNPTKHHMSNWPLIYRERWGRAYPERICEHGIGHPDPDDMNWYHRYHGEVKAYYEGIHGCDGCCDEHHYYAGKSIQESVDNGLI